MNGLEVVQRGVVAMPWVDQQMAIHARREGHATNLILAYWSHTGWCQYICARVEAASSGALARQQAFTFD